MSKICVDARLWGIKNTGIGRYIENLIDNLPEEVTLIVSPNVVNEPKLSKYKKYVAKLHPYSNMAQFEMVFLLWQIRPNLLHVPHFTIPVLWHGKMVVTIHDLIKHLSRGQDTTTRDPWVYWIKYIQYIVIVQIALWRASHIIVPAKYWKDILVINHHVPENKISVTYEGVDSSFSSIKIENSKLKIPYLLYVGNVYPHKNISVLLKAVTDLPKLKLIIVCGRSVFADRTNKMVSEYGLQDRVEFRHLVTDDELAALYKNSICFVTPSLIEGFGLPGLEAMAAGTPVIAARASCLPEIYEEAAVYFEPTSPSQLVERIYQLISDKESRKELIEKGFKQVKKYSWVQMGRQTWQIYQNVLR
jgi:glycosyltransferase involved in cell wall biosynthesis